MKSNEFKKITKKQETRYVLENCSAGATGAGSVASSPTSLGKLQRRLAELKDKITVPPSGKPRLGHQQAQTGAGGHKSKKDYQRKPKHPNRGIEENEFHDQFADFVKQFGGKARGSVEQQKATRDELFARRAAERAEREQQAAQDDAARLPELKAEYERMKARYKALGGSNWQYADREQNLSPSEREARGMESSLSDLAKRIAKAEKESYEKNIKEGYEHGFYDFMMMNPYRDDPGHPLEGIEEIPVTIEYNYSGQERPASYYGPAEDVEIEILKATAEVKGKTIDFYDEVEKYVGFKELEYEIKQDLRSNTDEGRSLPEEDDTTQDFIARGGVVQQLPPSRRKAHSKLGWGKHIGGRGETGAGKAGRIGHSAARVPFKKLEVNETDEYMEALDAALESILNEKAPPGEKYERMAKHIKAGYAKDGKLTPKEKSIAFATAWKAKKAEKGKKKSKKQVEAILGPNDSYETWNWVFQGFPPEHPRGHQFRGKTPEKKSQMAAAARYDAIQKS